MPPSQCAVCLGQRGATRKRAQHRGESRVVTPRPWGATRKRAQPRGESRVGTPQLHTTGRGDTPHTSLPAAAKSSTPVRKVTLRAADHWKSQPGVA